MDSGILTKFSASAGSGKTYRLTRIYLSMLFKSPHAYRRILAVTFTNKAAADMKQKILSQLHSISKGEESTMAAELAADTGLSLKELSVRAAQALKSILHDYSSFSVGTIDSFFQKVLKAFAREAGLPQGYLVELEHDIILKQAVDNTISSTSENKSLRKWISEYSGERVEEGLGWNLRKDILELAAEIFSEKFRLMPAADKEKLRNRDFLHTYITELRKIIKEFESSIKTQQQKCRHILDTYNVDDEMFFKGASGGVGSFLKMLNTTGAGNYLPPNATISKILETPPVWTAKSGPSPQVKMALENGFTEAFTDLLNFYNDNFIEANTASEILRNIYILGILSDILLNVHGVTSSSNKFLLSDAGELLNLIISGDQTPFIYEKFGNRFENFMIDEFQDTSLIQWSNFLPLIENSLAGGYDNLVVGDVKQSVYRWRNSDWTILGLLLQKQFAGERLRLEKLSTNWRSMKNIVAFNNSLFTLMPKLLDESEKNNTGDYLLEHLYSDSVQNCKKGSLEGHVRIEFLGNTEMRFEDQALERLPALIENLYDRGYSGSDIGILVRSNREGARVLSRVLDYNAGSGEQPPGKYNIRIISGDSLFLSASPAIIFIIAFLEMAMQPGNRYLSAVMLRNWIVAIDRDPLSVDLGESLDNIEQYLPDGLLSELSNVKDLPVFEAIERIILVSSLGEYEKNTVFLSSFQDYVLEFTDSESCDISAFLEWWKTTGISKCVSLSENPDSVRVMTIHKAKGLEFRVVIVPFISWNTGPFGPAGTIWASPSVKPFNNLGLVPVKYRKALVNTHFAGDFYREQYYSLVDNLNLLYVAFTRAIDSLYGFAPAEPRSNQIADTVLQALKQRTDIQKDKLLLNLSEFMSEDGLCFEIGLPGKGAIEAEIPAGDKFQGRKYFVTDAKERLRIRFHSENWIDRENEKRQASINYGNLMHAIFESVVTVSDIKPAMEKMVDQGRMLPGQRAEIEARIHDVLLSEKVKDWFKPGVRVMTEAEILIRGGSIKRPDRIMLDGSTVTVVDLKFGAEKPGYRKQVQQYIHLLNSMGYKDVEGYLWYVDRNIVIKV